MGKSIKINIPDGYEIDEEKSTFKEIVFKKKHNVKLLTFVDLNLPSGTLWATTNVEGYFTFDEAVEKFGNNLPTKEQWKELIENTSQVFKDEKLLIYKKGFNTSPVLEFPAAGYHNNTLVSNVGLDGYYWSSTATSAATYAYYLFFRGGLVTPQIYGNRYLGRSVRLIKNK